MRTFKSHRERKKKRYEKKSKREASQENRWMSFWHEAVREISMKQHSFQLILLCIYFYIQMYTF